MCVSAISEYILDIDVLWGLELKTAVGAISPASVCCYSSAEKLLTPR